MKKLQLWCIHSLTNLEQISRELQMLEHRDKMQDSAPAAGERKYFWQNFVIY
jgi:hypothetical protein